MVSSYSANRVHLLPPTAAEVFACPIAMTTQAESEQQREEEQRQQARRAQRSAGMGRR